MEGSPLNVKSSKNPRVSVVIPNYNYEIFLDERINSILNQSFDDYEIIFLDDASTDGSVEMVRNIFGEKIKEIVVNKQNSGSPFVQWNRGVRMAKGEFVWIAEADDTCTPNFLERMVQAMDKSSSIGLAYCNTTPIDVAGAVINEGFFNQYVSDLDPSRWHSDFSAEGINEVKDYLSKKNPITNVSGVLFRRDAFMQAGYAPEDMRMCGDWLAYCKVLHVSDVAFVASPMNFHRQHPNKQTLNSVLNLTYFREYLQVQKYVAEAFDQTSQEKREAFNRFLGEWDRLTVSNYGRIGVSRLTMLKDMAAKAYPDFGSRLVITVHFVVNVFKSLGAKWLKD
ncbi:MAG: glycosyltransferase family 2 protein [Mariprofundaceae bacterium]